MNNNISKEDQAAIATVTASMNKNRGIKNDSTLATEHTQVPGQSIEEAAVIDKVAASANANKNRGARV